VSALIHAATMVTAGVYMIGRTNVLFSMAPTTLHVVALVGGLTALFAATIGTAQNDIKKVLAYSTVSQLGYMFLGMGVGAYAAGIYHLVTHAFFKACLFLGSGSVIHAMHHEQDMRKMGGLRQWMPITHWTFLISTLCIAGIPGTSGFFSKDEILWKAWSGEHGHPLFWLMGFIGAGLTAFYMFRQVYMTFYGEFRGGHGHDDHGHGHGHGGGEHHPHESPLLMTVPLAILATLALLIGLVGIPHSLGGSLEFEQWLAPVFEQGHAAAAHHAAAAAAAHGEHGSSAMEYLLMAASVGVALFGIFVATSMYLWKTMSPDWFVNLAGGKVYEWVYNKYYVDEFYQATVINGTVRLALLLAWFDRTIVDGIVNGAAAVVRVGSFLNGLFDTYLIDGIVNRIADATLFAGQRFRQVQTGSINAYLYVIVGAVVVLMVAQLAWAG
jgi:NADH-quinone oxidoreductase subunit L